MGEQSAAFGAVQGRLQAELAALFEYAEGERQALEDSAGEAPDPRLGPLRSMLHHREGLEVFLSQPFMPMDNNPVERVLRRPVVGRKLSYGSHSEDGAALQGVLLSVLTTLDPGRIDLRRWLQAFLRACARIGSQAVVADPRAWLPRGMSEERFQQLRRAGDGPAP